VDAGEYPLIGPGRGLRSEGPVSVVVDDEEEHHAEADVDDEAVGPPGLSLPDLRPVKTEKADESEDIGESVDQTQPQGELALHRLGPLVRDIVDGKSGDTEGEAEEEGQGACHEQHRSLLYRAANR
jgi:hypothetical protein